MQRMKERVLMSVGLQPRPVLHGGDEEHKRAGCGTCSNAPRGRWRSSPSPWSVEAHPGLWSSLFVPVELVVADGQDVFQDGARSRLVWFHSLVSCAVNFVVRNWASCLWLIGISVAMLIDWVEVVDEKRQAESARIRDKYPDRIPVIVEKAGKTDVPEIDKKKYLVPADLTVGQFVYVVRKRIKLSPEKAIFVFVKNTLPPTASLMSAIYEENKDEDGFLYMTYSGENTFGSA
ncbi:unnamed protein product [Miscanthus lutarioriparius]|uniref:Autophagy-related protein n=1 Tax=Miscanthus lutarioriparius TaxID=422564 RepID=A0A811N1Y8_9POAL|nr:unnamed protein product [Miscanthus lutarioriparius]